MARPKFLLVLVTVTLSSALLAALWSATGSPAPDLDRAGSQASGPDLPSFPSDARFSAPSRAGGSGASGARWEPGRPTQEIHAQESLGPEAARLESRIGAVERRIAKETAYQKTLAERLARLDERGHEAEATRSARDEIEDFHFQLGLQGLLLGGPRETLVERVRKFLEENPGREELAGLGPLVEKGDAEGIEKWHAEHVGGGEIMRASLRMLSELVLRADEFLPELEEDLRAAPQRSLLSAMWLGQMFTSPDLSGEGRGEVRRIVLGTLADPSATAMSQHGILMGFWWTRRVDDPEMREGIRSFSVATLERAPSDVEEEKQLRRAATDALALFPDSPGTVQLLARALADDPDPRVRGNAAVALATVAPEAAKELLQRHIAREADPEVRARIQETLEKGPTSPMERMLEEAEKAKGK